jgi:hypothetical protein
MRDNSFFKELYDEDQNLKEVRLSRSHSRALDAALKKAREEVGKDKPLQNINPLWPWEKEAYNKLRRYHTYTGTNSLGDELSRCELHNLIFFFQCEGCVTLAKHQYE